MSKWLMDESRPDNYLFWIWRMSGAMQEGCCILEMNGCCNSSRAVALSLGSLTTHRESRWFNSCETRALELNLGAGSSRILFIAWTISSTRRNIYISRMPLKCAINQRALNAKPIRPCLIETKWNLNTVRILQISRRNKIYVSDKGSSHIWTPLVSSKNIWE